jgi:RNA polymerase sigma factor (sigma-70 family)
LADDDLIEQILQGNEQAATELIERYYASILRYCKWHCSDVEKAEDLTQETFLKLFRNLTGYKGKNAFKSYLYTIANHLCIDEGRRVKHLPLGDEEKIVNESGDIKRIEDKDEISYVQVYYEDILHDNHGYVYLLDEDENMVLPNCNIAFWDEERRGSYEEYILDISADELSEYAIYGHFFTCQNLVKGDWEVKFTIEQMKIL